MTSSSHVNEAEALRATYAGAKRKIAMLEEQVQNLQEMGTKPKSDITSSVTRGRVICRLISLFESVDELVDEHDRRRADEIDGDGDSDVPTLAQCRTFRGYALLSRHFPSLEQNLLDLDTSLLTVYFRDLRKGAGGARGDDAANLKPSIVSWIVALFENPSPPLMPTTKADRGFGHDSTGRLLCPIDFMWDDLEIRQQIRDGHPNYIVTASSWPAFLYPHAKGDQDNIVQGLFRGAILLKAFKFLFTSPTSAQDISCEDDVNAPPQMRPLKRARNTKAPTRGHVAQLLGMKSVTPRAIAYVAVQVRFALSNAGAWSDWDGCFSYIEFYNHILDFFENPPGPTAQQFSEILISWWTKKIFGVHVTANPLGQMHSGSLISKMASQRAARESAA